MLAILRNSLSSNFYKFQIKKNIILMRRKTEYKQKDHKDQQPIQPPLKKSTRNQSERVNKFFGHLNEQKQKEFLNRIKDYCGKNFPISYRPEYQFTEEWQSKQGSAESADSNLLQTQGPLYLTYSLLAMLMYTLGVWSISIQRHFQTRDISENIPIFKLLILFSVVDIILRAYINYRQTLNCFALIQVSKLFSSNFLVIAYCMITELFIITNPIMYIVELLIIYLLYKKAAEIYRYLKIMEIGLQYEHHVKITDLLLNIFIEAHIFAIILFLASKIDPEENWVKSIQIQDKSPLVKYLNSIYFACTTMLTIGYGDISPKSVGQKCITIIIEIVGVIAFGYLLNQMGHTLSKMREESQVMEKDLQTISKISKYYNLETKLQNKARNFIVNNKRKNQQLKSQDENRLLMKLNQDLRQEINLQNSLNVVKSSIFYLCHWSKSMQLEIAQRLEKRIFAPNEKIVSKNGQQDRIYIIKRGKIDISMNRYGSNQDHKKVLKVIDTSKSSDLQVTDNVYGYTAIFSNRPVRLQAMAKDFTSTYSVDKKDILFCVNQNTCDFEYFHEIKCRIDQSQFCEEWEAPAIKNIREHYCPSRFLIIKKYRKVLEESYNRRKNRLRNDKKLVKYSLLSMYENANHSDQHVSFRQNTIQFIARNRPPSLDSIDEESSGVSSSDTEFVQKKCHQLVKLRSLIFQKSFDENEKKKFISSSFQIGKTYKNFFKQNNLDFVLTKLQKQNSVERRFTEKTDSRAEQASRVYQYIDRAELIE